MTDAALDDLLKRLHEPIDYISDSGVPMVLVHGYLQEATAAIVALRADIERHVAIAAELAGEVERMRAENTKLREQVRELDEMSRMAWLVEIQHDGKLGGWISGDDSRGFGWTMDPNLAIRFCRKQDADWFRERYGFTCDTPSLRHCSTKHLWFPPDAAIDAAMKPATD